MYCAYARYQSEYGKAEYISGPEQFHEESGPDCSYRNVVYLINPTKEEQDLRVHSVGVERSFPEKCYVNRVLPYDTAIHYVVGGEGFYNGQRVKKGDCFVIFRQQPHTLFTAKERRLKMYWLLLRHPVDLPLSYFGLDPETPIFRYSFGSDMERIFHEMLHFRMGATDPHLFYLGKFFELMGLHKFKATLGNDMLQDSLYKNYVSMAKRIWADTSYRISVEEMAQTLGFSRKHFSYIFQSKTGISPKQYLLEQKIRVAKTMLEGGEISLKNLAYYLGYSEYSSFSRAFKSQVGLNPREYIAASCGKSAPEGPDGEDGQG